MSHADEFRRCLRDGDVEGLMEIWKLVAPHLPQPRDHEQAEIIMHRARTETKSISERARFYSHSWLIDHNFPSGLPDELKPKAERMYPKIASAVGISMMHEKSSRFGVVLKEARHSMENAVLEAEADGKLEDTKHVKSRMQEAKERTYKQLLG